MQKFIKSTTRRGGAERISFSLGYYGFLPCGMGSCLENMVPLPHSFHFSHSISQAGSMSIIGCTWFKWYRTIASCRLNSAKMNINQMSIKGGIVLAFSTSLLVEQRLCWIGCRVLCTSFMFHHHFNLFRCDGHVCILYEWSREVTGWSLVPTFYVHIRPWEILTSTLACFHGGSGDQIRIHDCIQERRTQKTHLCSLATLLGSPFTPVVWTWTVSLPEGQPLRAPQPDRRFC